MQQQQSGKQPQQMGFNGGGGGGGGNESNRGGLTRFWSAPSTWLDTLIQPEIENPPPPILPSPAAPPLPPPPPQNLNLPPQLPKLRNLNNYSSSQNNFFTDGTTELGFLRQNSSPAEILASLTSLSGVGSDDYLPNFGGSGNFDYLSSSLEFPNNKRSRGSEFHQEPRKNSPSMKAEQSEFSSFADMEMEKIFEDSVPCRVRAKRGCATHPRSIAERVRRTRISDRIRKLQDLVPNMDKQTNTADMLDEAVEYVKFLQNQIQELSEHQRNCKCLVRS